MKKFLVIILISIICIIPVQAEESIEIESIKAIKSSEGITLNDKNQVNVIFNDLNQTVNYEAVIKNNTDQKLYVNSLESENSKEKFIEYKLDSKSENMVLEPNSSSKILFQIKTLEIEGAGRNLDEQIKVNFLLSDKITNPNTFSNIIDLIILLSVLAGTMYLVRKHKKVQILILILGISTIGIYYVEANDYIKASLDGNIKYTSQNNIISTGTTLNDKQADYTNSKEVWAYYDKVKNIEVKSLIKEPSKYYKKFDLTENKTGRVMAYLINNNDQDTPYDLVIMSNGVVIANSDSSFMFSFPKTEKVEGLSNVDFRGTTTMQGMFIGNQNLKKIDTEALEMDNTKDTSYMFYKCNEIEHDLDDFNLENVETKDYMIAHALYKDIKKDTKLDNNIDFNKSSSGDNGDGKYLFTSTKDDKYPVYYYRGNVDNNNVLLNGMCWQIVRTTETGGTKLIYNGLAVDSKCPKKTGTDAFIAETKFNDLPTASPYDMSYMYGERYISNIKMGFASYYYFSTSYSISTTSNYYYATSVTYENGKYILQNPTQYVWQDNYKNLKGYYTCRSTTNTSCSTVYYVNDASASYQYLFLLKDGKSLSDKVIKLGKGYSYKENIYTLEDVITISYNDIMSSDTDKYENMYICPTNTSNSCSNLRYIGVINSGRYLATDFSDKFTYGNDIKYENGVYTLIDTYHTDNWGADYKDIAKKHHYTCLTTDTSCEEVYYVYNFDLSSVWYISLKNGETFETAKEKMLSNTYDSTAKTTIDNWYKTNLNDYNNYFEDTIWCNDRTFKFGALKGKNSEGYDDTFQLDNYTTFFYQKMNQSEFDFSCPSINDQFTVNKKNGNGKLIYPIGLLTANEINITGNDKNSFLNVDKPWWSITPAAVTADTTSLYYMKNFLSFSNETYSYGIRPSVSLKNSIKYVTGDGTVNNPYVIE